MIEPKHRPGYDQKTTCFTSRRPSLAIDRSAPFVPDPYRGLNRYSLARIRAQKEPVIHRRAPASNTGSRKSVLSDRTRSLRALFR
jgi:hypothetical protein